MTDHRAPDWKIHFSVTKGDVAKAFDLLAELFHVKKCKFGLKATVPNIYPPYEWEWPPHMRGREITLYIYQYYDTTQNRHFVKYDKVNSQDDDQVAQYIVSERIDLSTISKRDFSEYFEKSSFHDLQLPRYGHSWAFYRDFIRSAEDILSKNNIVPNGCADGDLPLGKYASLRNETFVIIENRFIYPPNGCGYNGAECKDVKDELVGWNSLYNRIMDNALPYQDLCTKNQVITRVGVAAVGALVIGAATYWAGMKYGSTIQKLIFK
jgi:hypothetical protein